MSCATVFVYVFLRRRRRLSAVGDVPGPVNPSWIFGTSAWPLRLCISMALNTRTFKDTDGTSWLKKLEEQKRGSSRISEISFVGMALLGCVVLFVECTPELYI